METDMRPTPIGRFTDTPSYDELQREVARLRLTDAERFVLREVRDIYADQGDVKCDEIAAAIDGLLERLG
jgi:hypothetical protein